LSHAGAMNYTGRPTGEHTNKFYGTKQDSVYIIEFKVVEDKEEKALKQIKEKIL